MVRPVQFCVLRTEKGMSWIASWCQLLSSLLHQGRCGCDWWVPFRSVFQIVKLEKNGIGYHYILANLVSGAMTCGPVLSFPHPGFEVASHPPVWTMWEEEAIRSGIAKPQRHQMYFFSSVLPLLKNKQKKCNLRDKEGGYFSLQF